MSDIKDGGPAFGYNCDRETCEHIDCKGMSLRDWFAGMALCSCPPHNLNEYDKNAEWCYKMADAMISARGGE